MTSPARTALGAAQVVLGTATLLRPSATVRALTRGHGAVPNSRIVRVLGARQVVQGVATLARPSEDTLAAGAVVDVLHAASLVPLVAFSSRYRAPAAVSALLATGAAAAAWAASR